MIQKTTEQARNMNLNPTGKGGFGDNPENINAGGRPKHSPQYWLNQYGKLTNKEFKELLMGFKSGALDEELTVNQILAIQHIASSNKFEVRKDLLNRVDGMPTQRNEVTGLDGKDLIPNITHEEAIQILREEIKNDNNKGTTESS